jgi:transposase InsO family protein
MLFLRCAAAFFRSRNEQVIVELALRQQLATYVQNQAKAKLTTIDRAFWIALLRFWPRWRDALVIVKPDTVIRWHRKGFRLYWRWISKRGPGRPRISEEVRELIRRFALENHWGARKVHAELGKLGISVSLATVSRYMPKKPRNKGKQQSWMTFLRNHKDGIVAMDFFVIPTLGFRLLYVWFVIDHGRRRIIHFNVTTHPTAQWVIQQLRESFPGDSSARYLIYDNDSIFSNEVSKTIRLLGIKPKRTAYRSPWQNGTAERWVGSCKREIIDHVIVLNEDQLRRLLRDYVSYYNTERVHTRLQDAPEGREVEVRSALGAKVVGLPRVTRKLHFLPSTIVTFGKKQRDVWVSAGELFQRERRSHSDNTQA